MDGSIIADICRIRLDYDTLILTQPTAAATIASAGQCATDKLTVRRMHQVMELTDFDIHKIQFLIITSGIILTIAPLDPDLQTKRS